MRAVAHTVTFLQLEAQRFYQKHKPFFVHPSSTNSSNRAAHLVIVQISRICPIIASQIECGSTSTEISFLIQYFPGFTFSA
jgi:hypothetical protein